MNREIVVTGGSAGIGYAIAAAFVREGDRVTVTGRRESVLTEAAALLGARAVSFDAGDPEAVEAACAQLPDRVDVLVNNAGGNTDFEREDGADLKALETAWLANLRANLFTAALVTAGLRDRLADQGRVVTIGSIAARTGAGSYGWSKAALELWNAEVAREFGPRGITANIVAPGLVVDTEFFHGKLTAERQETLIGNTMTKRAGRPEDIAEVVRFLASPEAGHVTGQVLHVNGGAYVSRG
ncbi:SDR family NAD(P)-dependent oxidoreductase [Amycolatopsis jejuensis]|uniref:SDR family NAD(P)-dependent oxidoreductase n=1 Tax=Amycolatopsis jejuensis TaxID=330084 RepID=UPI0005261295|nr:SDR family oxidoreductase [Amycolatopsis jejuensis]